MKKIKKLCKWCFNEIPKTKRSDSKYCCNICNVSFHNWKSLISKRNNIKSAKKAIHVTALLHNKEA